MHNEQVTQSGRCVRYLSHDSFMAAASSFFLFPKLSFPGSVVTLPSFLPVLSIPRLRLSALLCVPFWFALHQEDNISR
jgi:hypothetical protein